MRHCFVFTLLLGVCLSQEFVNIAVEGTASQTSTYNEISNASNAIDGNTNGIFRDKSCTHTRRANQNTWSVLLKGGAFGAKYPIHKVVLYNRMDCCQDRLKFAKVFVDNQMCGEVQFRQGQNKDKYEINCNGRMGGRVSVERNNEPLTLCEVEVYVPKDKANTDFPAYVNVATKGKATQSSVGWAGTADRAIDGNTDGSYRGKSCTHTRFSRNNKWSVALDQEYAVEKIIIYNRQDCCGNRINTSKVWLDEQMVGEIQYNRNPVYSFDVRGRRGSRVTITNSQHYLTLCEVEVYVKEEEESTEVVDEE